MGFSRTSAYTGPTIVDANAPPPTGYMVDPSIAGQGGFIPIPRGNESGIFYQGGTRLFKPQIGGVEYQDLTAPQFQYLDKYVKDRSLISGGATPSSNINYPADTSSFWSEISPYLTVLAPFAAGLAAPAMLGASGTSTQAGMLGAQEAGFSAADLAGWGGATTAEGTAAGTSLKSLADYAKTAKNLYGMANTISGGSTPSRTTTGGNMATQGTTGSGMNLQDLSNVLTPLLGMYTSGQQGKQINQGYQQGVNMITTPSPDQQFYRTELQKMFTDPSSFYQGAPYQAAFGQGQQATERAINAQGLTGSGRELAELQKYGQTFGWDQMMKQAGLFGNLSGVADDTQARARGGAALINQGQAQAGTTGAIAGDLSTGAARLLGGGLGGSNLGGTTLEGLFTKANEWFNAPSDSTQYSDLLSQQGDFNWSGMEGVIGGSEQDMMLNDQWDWSW